MTNSLFKEYEWAVVLKSSLMVIKWS